MYFKRLGDRRGLKWAKGVFFHLNFYRVHLLYFVLVIIVSSGILYGSSTSDFKLAYIDAIYLCTSAMCNVGLTSVNLGSLTGFQQSVIFIVMLLGDLTIVTVSVVVVRRHYFSKHICHLLETSEAGRKIAADIARQRGNGDAESGMEGVLSRSPAALPGESANTGPTTGSYSLLKAERTSGIPKSHEAGYGSFPAPWNSVPSLLHRYWNVGKTADSAMEHHYGRFISLSAEQEAELGGVEYRALKVLTWLLPAYTVFWLFIIMVVLTPYAAHSHAASVIHTSQPGDLSPTWWAVFMTASAYSNSGLSLINANMIPFARDYLVLIFTGAAILSGNTLYPVFLRLTVWLLAKFVRRTSELHHALSFLLHHPRRCYLLLFPSSNTWILLVTQIAINLIAWIFWILLSIDQPSVETSIPPGQRVMDGLFQAHGIRAAGFYIINMSDIAPALQFFYMVLMYISAFPLIMSLRESNVYEERSLGQSDKSKYGSTGSEGDDAPKTSIGVHFRQQLAYDIWWLVLAIFVICITEHGNLNTRAPGFTIFSVIFEVVSAYGTVGLSLGVPYNDYSFSGAWRVLSKLILLTVMLRGRHRILPLAIDRAVLLPGQELMERLDKEYRDSPNEQHWQEMERKIRKVESGEEAERPVKSQ